MFIICKFVVCVMQLYLNLWRDNLYNYYVNSYHFKNLRLF